VPLAEATNRAAQRNQPLPYGRMRASAVMPLVADLYDQAIARGEALFDTTAAFRFPVGK